MVKTPKVLNDLLKPLTDRNEMLANETQEEKINRIKMMYGLHHGSGVRKQKQRSKRKK